MVNAQYKVMGNVQLFFSNMGNISKHLSFAIVVTKENSAGTFFSQLSCKAAGINFPNKKASNSLKYQ